MSDINMPALGSAEIATIERYFKQPGDLVSAGEPILIAVTDRFEWDVPASAPGTITEIVAQPGSTVPIGAAVVRLDPVVDPLGNDDRVCCTERIRFATPVARRIAETHGLDLTTVAGTGPGGRIMRADVAARVDPSALEVSAGRIDSRISRDARDLANLPPDAITNALDPGLPATAADYSHPKITVPHAMTAVEADLTMCLAYIDQHDQGFRRRGVVPSMAACIASAIVGALIKHPRLNSAYTDDGIILWQRINLRVKEHADARTTRAIIADAAELSTQGLARAIYDGSVATDRGATFEVVLGTARWSQAIISPGSSAALFAGNIERRPSVIEHRDHDEIAMRPLALLALAYDARVIAPPEADDFLINVKRRLEHFSPL